MAQKYKNIKWLVFDFDGVIGYANHPVLIDLWSREFDVPRDYLKVFLTGKQKDLQLDRISTDDFWKELNKEFNYGGVNTAGQVWSDYYTLACNIDFELLNYIEELKNDYKICLLSNTSRLYDNEVIENVLAKVFDKRIYSYLVKYRKPDSNIYSIAFQDMQCTAENCVFIDNLKRNLEYPKEKGALTIWYSNLETLKKELHVMLGRV